MPNELNAKDFYDTMTKVEGRIVAKIDGVKTDVAKLSREVGEVERDVTNNGVILDAACKDIEYLERRDKGIMAVATALGGAIGTAGAYVISVIKGE